MNEFGGIDAVINNASAISLTGLTETTSKRYDLMWDINARGSFLLTTKCIPYLQKSQQNPHVLFMSPPPFSHRPEWFNRKVAYAASKFAMSLWVLGMSHELKGRVAVNALWPKTLIATSALQAINPAEYASLSRQGRHSTIMADAAFVILSQPTAFTGMLVSYLLGAFCIDEQVLRDSNPAVDLEQYAVDSTQQLQEDFFIDEEYQSPPLKSKL